MKIIVNMFLKKSKYTRKKIQVLTGFLTTQVQMQAGQFRAASLRVSLCPPLPQEFISVSPLKMLT